MLESFHQQNESSPREHQHHNVIRSLCFAQMDNYNIWFKAFPKNMFRQMEMTSFPKGVGVKKGTTQTKSMRSPAVPEFNYYSYLSAARLPQGQTYEASDDQVLSQLGDLLLRVVYGRPSGRKAMRGVKREK